MGDVGCLYKDGNQLTLGPSRCDDEIANIIAISDSMVYRTNPRFAEGDLEIALNERRVSQ